MYRLLLFMIATLMGVAVGCAPPAVGSPGGAISAPSGAETPLSTPVSETPAVTPGAGTSPLATPAAGSTGELTPDFANQALEWLAGETGVSVGDLRLVEAERIEWTDSCFGLGGPAESCLAAMTPGWRIVFEAAGQQYEVRTDEAGSNFRLAPQES